MEIKDYPYPKAVYNAATITTDTAWRTFDIPTNATLRPRLFTRAFTADGPASPDLLQSANTYGACLP